MPKVRLFALRQDVRRVDLWAGREVLALRARDWGVLVDIVEGLC